MDASGQQRKTLTSRAAWTRLQERATVSARKPIAVCVQQAEADDPTSGLPSPSATNGAVTTDEPGRLERL